MAGKTYRLGLTGGIASGKSAVQTLLEARGHSVFDADSVYHQLLREDDVMLAALRAAFGGGVFSEDGSLDRKALGAKVFADPAALRRLGEITHPLVRAKLAELMDEASEADPAPALVVSAVPLLFEGGLEHLFDGTLLISASPETQLARLMNRDSLSESDAQARIASQMPLDEKRRRANYELANDGDLSETEVALDALLSRLPSGSPDC